MTDLLARQLRERELCKLSPKAELAGRYYTSAPLRRHGHAHQLQIS